MIKYPLYDELQRLVNEKEDKSIDVNSVCLTLNAISRLTQIEQTEHAALILHHEMIENKGVLLTVIPYDGKLMPGNKNILFSFVKLPLALKQIIAQYIDYFKEQIQ
jgi:hypothetical protein